MENDFATMYLKATLYSLSVFARKSKKKLLLNGKSLRTKQSRNLPFWSIRHSERTSIGNR